VSGILVALKNMKRFHVIAEQWAHMSVICQQLSIQAYNHMVRVELAIDKSSQWVEDKRTEMLEFSDYCALQSF